MRKFFRGKVGYRTVELFVDIIKSTRKHLAFLGIIALLWSYVPWEQIHADINDDLLPTEEFLETEDNTDDTSNEYPSTTDADFDYGSIKIIEEIVSKRTEKSKTFLKEDGTYLVAIYDESVHYLENGNWIQINNSLNDLGDELETNKNLFKLKFPKYLDDNKQIKLTLGDYSIDWNVLGIENSSIEYSSENIESNNLKELENITDSVLYSNIQPNVDLEYVVTGTEIKENIVLNSYIQNFSMEFEYKLKNLSLIQDDSNNLLFVNDDGYVVFMFNPLIMLDSSMDESYDIQYTIEETSNKTYSVKIKPNDEWLKTAEYPVIIDPSILYSYNDGFIQDKYVYTDRYNIPRSVNTSYLLVGSTSTYDYRSYINLNLSMLPEDIQVSYAHLQLYTYGTADNNHCDNDCNILLKEVFDTTTYSSIAGYGLNITNDRIIDYEIVQSTDDVKTYYWDISRNFQQWFFDGDSNRTLELRREDESNYGYIYFRSSSYSTLGPIVEVGYQKLGGIKDYWTYSEQSAGTAGIGLVSDYTGQLNFTRQDLNYTTDLQSLNLSMIFNLADKDSNYGYGDGWLTNYNLLLYYDNDSGQWYSTDASGYKRYYYLDKDFGTGVNSTCDDRFENMVDTVCRVAEDGSRDVLVLRYEDFGFESVVVERIVVTLEQVYFHFDSFGRLFKIVDEKHNTEINISYQSYTKIKISSITDEAGNYIELVYIDGNNDSDNTDYEDYLKYARLHIIYDDTVNYEEYHLLQETEYDYYTGYTGKIQLEEVIFKTDYDNNTSLDTSYTSDYDFDTNNQLLFAKSSLGDKVVYTYENNRVKTITQYLNGANFGSVEYDYTYRKTQITNHLDQSITYLFDIYGHTVQVADSFGFVQSFKYINIFMGTYYDQTFFPLNDNYRNYRLNHKLIYSSIPELSFFDPIQNGNFEEGISSDKWSLVVDDDGIYNNVNNALQDYVESDFVFGNKSAMLSYNDSTMESHLEQSIKLDVGTYILQTYIKNHGQNTNAYVSVSGATSIITPSNLVSNNGEWEQVSVKFSVTSEDQNVTIKIMNATNGTIYVDAVQLIEGYRNASNNLYFNPSFESDISNEWVLTSGASRYEYINETNGIYADLLGNHGIRIDGDTSTLEHTRTNIGQYMNLIEGSTYTLSLWGYSEGTPKKLNSNGQSSYFRVKISYYNQLQEIDTIYIYFDQDIEGWQKLSTEIVIPSNLTNIYLDIEYLGLGYIVYDGLSVLSDSKINEYQYDNAGNITSYIDDANNITTLNYDVDENEKPLSNTPEKINTLQNSISIPYNDDYLPEYIIVNNVRVTHTYDEFGRPIVLTYGESAQTFSSSTVYNSGTFHQFVLSTTDEFGKTTEYDYNVLNGLLDSVENANGNILEYEYYQDGYLHKVMNNGYCEEDSPLDCAYVEYIYNWDKQLEKIILDSGYYYFLHYNPTGKIDEVYVINTNESYYQLLMSYEYVFEGTNDEYETTSIHRQTYANGDFIQFSYDVNDRIDGVYYNDEFNDPILRYSYEYNQQNQIAVLNNHDSNGDIIYSEYYTYENGNILSISTSEGNTIVYGYTDSGDLSGLTYTVNGKTQTVQYDNYEEMEINKDILDEKILGNYIMNNSEFENSDTDFDIQHDLIHVSLNTIDADPVFGGPIEVMPDANYSISVDVESTLNQMQIVVYQYSSSNFESSTFVTYSSSSLSSATGQRILNFSTDEDTKYVMVSIFSLGLNEFTITDFELDYSGLDETSAYDNTIYTTQDAQEVLKNYVYDNDALKKLKYIDLVNGTYDIRQNFEYFGNTTRIESIEFVIDEDDDGVAENTITYVYEYDNVGNITDISYWKNSTNILEEHYEYDSQNQLILEEKNDFSNCTQFTNSCYTISYSYDLRGNLTDIKKFAYGEAEGISQTFGTTSNWYLGGYISSCAYNSYTARLSIIYPETILDSDTSVQISIEGNEGFSSSMGTTFYKITISGYAYTIAINEDSDVNTINIPLSRLTWDSNQQGYKLDYQMLYWSGCNSGYSYYAPSDVYIGTTESFGSVPNEHVRYYYSDKWKDQLTNIAEIEYDVNGNEITPSVFEHTYTYDSLGNPTTITKFEYESIIYEYAELEYNGRQLTKILLYDSFEQLQLEVTYTYNDSGIRTSKTVGNTTIGYETTNYFISGNMVLYESNTNYDIIYAYDHNGQIISFNFDDGTYSSEIYYLRNLQGDIIALVDSSGIILVEYSYDAWGNILETKLNSNYTSEAQRANDYNRYFYRGYRYDNDTSLYYLNSRYYNANTGRFLNADGILGSKGDILSHNMYAYTKNNPVMLTDGTGYSPTAGVALGIASGPVGWAILAVVAIAAVVIATNPDILNGFPSPSDIQKQIKTKISEGIAYVALATATAYSDKFLSGYYVYTLSDDNGVFYVGITRNWDQRMSAHRSRFGSFEPTKICIDCSLAQARVIETAAIAYFKSDAYLGRNENRIFSISDGRFSRSILLNKVESDVLLLLGR
jgi:RHS repeat-associated protein